MKFTIPDTSMVSMNIIQNASNKNVIPLGIVMILVILDTIIFTKQYMKEKGIEISVVKKRMNMLINNFTL